MRNTYNKHKTHMIYSFKLKIKRFTIITLLLIFNISLFFSYRIMEKNFKPTVSALAVSYVTTYTTDFINNSVKQIQKHNFDYSDICVISKNDNGEIISISTNANIVNSIKLKLSEKIVQSSTNPKYQEHKIPVGNLSNSYILSGRGPEIPIRILTSSSPKISVESSFESTGINQTKHKISIVTNVDVKIILPYETITKNIISESLLCETIIVGKVPDVYIAK